MNYNTNFFQYNTQNNSILSNNDITMKNQKQVKQKPSNVNPLQRGRNTRQFGDDLTNISNNTNKFNNFTKVDNNKKIALARKDSISSKKHTKQQDLRTKKTVKAVGNMEIDNSAKNLKMEISNNSFRGSSMILDEPIMTRNQVAEKLSTNSPQLVLEYIEPIIRCFYETESNPNNRFFYPYSEYMKHAQRDINDKMRVILFDWLVDVHLKWKLLPDTLFLTFNIIDRFLGMKPTPRDELQCVGVAALLLACKYEEIYFPELSDFQEITDNAFSKQEILKKEIEILDYLKYDLTVPSPLKFFEVFNVYLKLEEKEKAAVLYLIEMCSFDYSMLKYKPSLIATGCLMLVVSYNKHLKETLFFISNYSLDDISNFLKDLLKVYYKPDHGSKSLKRKFGQSKFLEVSKVDVVQELHSRYDKYNSNNYVKNNNITEFFN